MLDKEVLNSLPYNSIPSDLPTCVDQDDTMESFILEPVISPSERLSTKMDTYFSISLFQFKKKSKLEVKKIKNKISKIKINIYKKNNFHSKILSISFFLKLLEKKENFNIRLVLKSLKNSFLLKL